MQIFHIADETNNVRLKFSFQFFGFIDEYDTDIFI